jgi:hypothetical protein
LKKLHLDFLVIGAQKSGTSSLHEWLIQIPEISLPEIKETHFFSDSNLHKLGIDWYLQQFTKKEASKTKTGEIDPDYLFSETAPLLIKKLTDINKFIIILRQPLDRAYSNYLMSVRRGYENLSFENALLIEKERLNKLDIFALNNHSYLARSSYAKQILNFKKTFPNAKFLFVKFEDLISAGTQLTTFTEICDFIGVNLPVKSIDLSIQVNPSSQPIFLFIRNILFNNSYFFNFIRKIGRLFFITQKSRQQFGIRLDKINNKPIKKNQEQIQIKDIEIQKEVLMIIKETATITGLDLTDWIR